MAEEKEKLTQEQIGDLVRRLLGPPEEWDDVAADFVLKVYGIDAGSPGAYVKELILREIRARHGRREAVPRMLLRMLTSLSEPRKSEEGSAAAEDYVKQRMKRSARAVRADEEFRFLRAGRRVPGKLSAADKQILKELEEELAGDLDTGE
jgi:hypothetical protein